MLNAFEVNDEGDFERNFPNGVTLVVWFHKERQEQRRLPLPGGRGFVRAPKWCWTVYAPEEAVELHLAHGEADSAQDAAACGLTAIINLNEGTD